MFSRKKKLAFNTASSLALQIVTVICGFILPRAILAAFGSEVNGLINSITQFLSVITFMELGIGSVVQSSLYNPLANNDIDETSRIYVSANKFFKVIAKILLLYVIVLLIVYPYISKNSFSWLFIDILIVSISVNSFAQYYFGIVNQLLLNSDQKGYIQYTTQIITLIINTIVSLLLIKLGCSIHIVKISTSLIYLMRPLFLYLYVKKHYSINTKITYKEEPIKQKWNGVAQHISYVVLQDTDSIVLTMFSTLSNVSIYGVYNIVVLGIKQLLISVTNGFRSLLGELWVKREIDTLNDTFGFFEWLIHFLTILVFGCTSVLILPFVQVYTYGITDANYIQPVFAVLISVAHACHCLRLPYNTIILAAGHYKQTQANSIIAAVINIIISIVTVFKFGLIGVAIGTMVAMLYQTIWMAYYVSKNIHKWPFCKFVKQMIIDIVTAVIGTLATRWIDLKEISYLHWSIMAIKVGVIWLIISIFLNIIFYNDMMKRIYSRFLFKLVSHR